MNYEQYGISYVAIGLPGFRKYALGIAWNLSVAVAKHSLSCKLHIKLMSADLNN